MLEKRDIVITIQKQFLEQILAKTKKIEFRKCWPAHPISTIWFCEKGSNGKIRGRGIALKSEHLPVDKAWRLYGPSTGIKENLFLNYVGNKKKVHCIHLSDVHPLEDINLSNLGLTHSPQNFSYVKI